MLMKVLIVLTSHSVLGTTGKPTGFYLPEVAHPYFELKEKGIEVDIASIQGGEAPVDPKSIDLDDSANKQMWEVDEHRSKLRTTLKLADVDAKKYQAVLYAGGHGTMWDFRGDTFVATVTKQIWENGGVVAAVCHGPAALVDVKLSDGSFLLSGKKVTGFTNKEEEMVELTEIMPFLLETQMKDNGATFDAGKPWQENVVVDGSLVTGQNPASAKKVGASVAEILTSKRS